MGANTKRCLCVLLLLARLIPSQPDLSTVTACQVFHDFNGDGELQPNFFERCSTGVADTPFQLFYTVFPDDNKLEILVRREREAWVGVGFTPRSARMNPATAVAGWINPGDQQIIVRDYLLEFKDGRNNQNGQDPPMADGDPPTRQNVRNTSVSFVDGWTQVYFERDLTVADPRVPDVQLDGSHTNVIMAAGNQPQDGALHAHNDDHFAVQANFADGTFVHQLDNRVAIHATLMATAWGVLVPASLVIARHSKNECHPMWFWLHRGMNTIAILLMSASWLFAVTDFGSKQHRTHLALGTVAVALAVLQPLNAFFRPRKTHGDKPNHLRHVWELIHFWLGRIALGFAFANMVIGFTIYNIDLIWTLFLWITLGLVLVGYVYFEIRGNQKIRPIRVAKEKLSVGVLDKGEVAPLVFRESTVAGSGTTSGIFQSNADLTETLRLDIIEDANAKEPSHRESMRRDLLSVDGNQVRRWSYIH